MCCDARMSRYVAKAGKRRTTGMPGLNGWLVHCLGDGYQYCVLSGGVMQNVIQGLMLKYCVALLLLFRLFFTQHAPPPPGKLCRR